jgi:hypothetical protein
MLEEWDIHGRLLSSRFGGSLMNTELADAKSYAAASVHVVRAWSRSNG